jgi:hypothetical protein
VLRGQKHKNYGRTTGFDEKTFLTAINDVI